MRSWQSISGSPLATTTQTSYWLCPSGCLASLNVRVVRAVRVRGWINVIQTDERGLHKFISHVHLLLLLLRGTLLSARWRTGTSYKIQTPCKWKGWILRGDSSVIGILRLEVGLNFNKIEGSENEKKKIDYKTICLSLVCLETAHIAGMRSIVENRKWRHHSTARMNWIVLSRFLLWTFETF